jgi:colanic acid/amylovoran biosynthesis protein
MKYSITHCYTDKNKGDAAIIIATVQLIKSIDNNAEINMFSTYGIKDKRFVEDHKIIKNYASTLYPGCFHDPEILWGNSDKSRIISFFLIFLKSTFLLITKKNILLKIFYKKEEIKAINSFLDSDIIISKGGSYLTTQNTSIRQTLSFIRMLYPFIVAKRYNKKMYIFSQSLGPVKGRFNQWLFKKVLKNVNKIYLRESLCLEKYKSVKFLCKYVYCKVIPDTAFYLKSDSSDSSSLPINISKYNVGYTLVDHAFKYILSDIERDIKINKYKNSIIDSMKFLIDNYNADIHIFPQVLVDNSFKGHNDIKISKEIKESFIGTKYENKVNFYNENLSPLELRNAYSKMKIFIGTRLHSVIFSLSVGVPSINISYHGTKSQGILNNIKYFEKFVLDIDTISADYIIKKIKELIKNRKFLSDHLKSEVNKINLKLEEAMKELIFEQNK